MNESVLLCVYVCVYIHIHIHTYIHNREEGYACFVRVTRGDDENAACGQLATNARKQA
jgi:adenine C2-methylase RlmN of 23S rRNA A2503 and tRNA A37